MRSDNDMNDSKETNENSNENDEFEIPAKAKKYNLKTRMKEAIEDEEEYLKLDAVGKYQFKYNKVTGLSNNYPEMFASDKPHIIAPGEGRCRIHLLF